MIVLFFFARVERSHMIRKVGSDITQAGTVTKYVSEFPASAVIFELLISRAPAPLREAPGRGREAGKAAMFLWRNILSDKE